MNIIFSYTDIRILLSIVAFFVIMNLVGVRLKRAWFAMASSILSLALMIVHVMLKEHFTNSELIYNVCIDMTFLAVNLSALLIVDEIESRRSIIQNVFENKYKKK